MRIRGPDPGQWRFQDSTDILPWAQRIRSKDVCGYRSMTCYRKARLVASHPQIRADADLPQCRRFAMNRTCTPKHTTQQSRRDRRRNVRTAGCEAVNLDQEDIQHRLHHTNFAKGASRRAPVAHIVTTLFSGSRPRRAFAVQDSQPIYVYNDRRICRRCCAQR